MTPSDSPTSAASTGPASGVLRRPVRLLLVDDDEDDYLLTRDLVAQMGPDYALDWLPDFDAGLRAVATGTHDVYLIDYRIGARTGLDLLTETRSVPGRGPMILLTGQGEFEIDRAAMRAGAADYLEKARLTPAVLERSVRYALRQRRTEHELEAKVAERTAALIAANAALQEADGRKDEFLATLAHELRNPLAPIRNALEIMRLAEFAPAPSRQAHAMMDRQVRQMVRLIDGLMDISRITRGKLRLTPEPLDLGDVLAEAVDAAEPQFEKAGVAFAHDVPPLPRPVYGDRLRLTQVFANILSNALKYTEPGGRVELGVAPGPPNGEESEGGYCVTVRDTGVGIPPELLPTIFDLFTQIDRTLNRSQGGLGIGLALVKQLATLHGGAVEAHSEGAGRGATFAVTLPGRAAGERKLEGMS